jgi:hypothetical protein
VNEIHDDRANRNAAALRIAMPLAAAFLAALAAHVAIDIAGDFLLAHDTYDDVAHGSRWLASIALAVSALCALGLLARAVIAETRGSRGALRSAFSAAVPVSAAKFGFVVTGAALPLLAGMAWLDAVFGGIAVDDIGDLFGGSIPLGAGTTIAFAFAIAIGVHGLVRFLSRFHRSIVRAVEAFARIARGAVREPQLAGSVMRPDRPRVLPALARCSSGNRAPPESLQPLLA